MSDLNPYQTPTTIESSATESTLWITDELRRVRTGLFIVYYGIVAILLGMVGGPVAAIVAGAAGFDTLAVVSTMLLGLAFIGGGLAIFVGQVLCLSVPANSNARGMITGSVVIQALGFLFTLGSMAFFVAGARNANTPADPIFALIGSAQVLTAIMGLVGLFLFVAFLKRLNGFICNESLVGSSNTVLRLMIALIGGYLVIVVLVMVASNAVIRNTAAKGAVLIGVPGLVILILGLVTFVKYANLVIYTAKAIGQMEQPLDKNLG